MSYSRIARLLSATVRALSFLKLDQSTKRQLLALTTAGFVLLQPTLLIAQRTRVLETKKTITAKPGKSNFGGPYISITTLGTPITQNFDTLATSGTANAWADDTTLPGWYSQFTAVTTNPTTYR